MTATAVTFPNTSPKTGVASSLSAVVSLLAGESVNYAYFPTATSNGRGAQFWISSVTVGTPTTDEMVPLIVKWNDRAAVQGYVNPQWAITINGPIDYVLDCSNDINANYKFYA